MSPFQIMERNGELARVVAASTATAVSIMLRPKRCFVQGGYLMRFVQARGFMKVVIVDGKKVVGRGP